MGLGKVGCSVRIFMSCTTFPKIELHDGDISKGDRFVVRSGSWVRSDSMIELGTELVL